MSEAAFPERAPATLGHGPAVYRAIITRSSEAIAIIDPEGCYLEQNAAHRALIGYDDRELEGRTPAIHLGQARFSEIATELARSGVYRGEVNSRSRDGHALVLELSAFAVSDDDGQPLCYVGIKRDVTVRKQAEAELRRRYEQLQVLYRLTAALARARRLEEVYSQALDEIEHGIGARRAAVLLFDEDGVLRFKAWRGLTEAYRNRVEGHTPWAPDTPAARSVLVRDVAAEPPLEAFAETFRSEGIGALGFFPLVVRNRLLGKLMVYYAEPFPFPPETVQLAEAIASHVALAIARSRDEEKLRIGQALLAAQVEASPDGILAVSPKGEVVTSNRRFAEMWGLDAELLATGSDAALLAAAEARLADPEGFLARVEHLYAHSEERGTDELRLLDGRVFERYSAPVHGGSESPHGRIWFFRDVTEQRRAEERERLLADAGRILGSSLELEATLPALAERLVPILGDWCAVDVVEEDGRFLRLGAAHFDPVLGEAVRQAGPWPRRAGPGARAVRTGETQVLARPDLRDLTRGAGRLDALQRLEPHHLVVAPLLARGRTVGVVTAACSQQEQAYGPWERALVEALARRAAVAVDNALLYRSAKAANRAKADFLAVMSHELRTPLNAILGYTDLMLLGVPRPLPEPSRLHVERVGASARHLLGIIEQILAFSRLEAGGAAPSFRPVELGALLDETADVIGPLAARKSLSFVLRRPPGPVVIETDQGRLRQVLLNLLSNAVKFTDAGRVSLAARCGRRHVTLTVRDTGAGIPRDDIDRIFEPFHQLDRTPGDAGGTGLGLSVAKGLTELLGGTLSVESKPGRGSVFRVRLPGKPGEARRSGAGRRTRVWRRLSRGSG